INCNLTAVSATMRLATEIKFYCLPRVPAFCLQAQTRRRLIPAMRHAVFTARVARHALDNAVFLPLHFLEHLGVSFVMAFGSDLVSHEIAWRFPAQHVPRRDRP